jgi:DNA modification methylase
MKIQEVKISEVKANPNNPRIIKDEKFSKLVESIKTFPEMLKLRPIVVNHDMIVLGGNMRLKACKEAGLKMVPIIRAEDLTDDQQREFIIKDNVGYGDWDWEELANNWEAEKLDEWGLDVPDFKVEPEAEEDDYEVPETITTDIVPGDLFEIGDHRLLCGDSTNADDVARLLNGKEPYLMVTDPPYGVKYDPNWRNEAERSDGGKIGALAIGKVKNDDNADWTSAWALSPSKVAYVWSSDRFAFDTVQSILNADFQVRNQIIWVKSHFAISRGDYHSMHEPCWYAVKRGSKGNWAGDRKQTTVWEIPKAQKNETGHGTQKPIECMARAISNHEGDVYEPFCGSGSTMVAAHQLERKCYGMELDPKYCQVIVDRMRKLDPALVIKRNGEVI